MIRQVFAQLDQFSIKNIKYFLFPFDQRCSLEELTCLFQRIWPTSILTPWLPRSISYKSHKIRSALCNCLEASDIYPWEFSNRWDDLISKQQNKFRLINDDEKNDLEQNSTRKHSFEFKYLVQTIPDSYRRGRAYKFKFCLSVHHCFDISNLDPSNQRRIMSDPTESPDPTRSNRFARFTKITIFARMTRLARITKFTRIIRFIWITRFKRGRVYYWSPQKVFYFTFLRQLCNCAIF